MNSTSEVTKEKLAADLKVVVADAEELLRATAGQAGDQIVELRNKIETRLGAARKTLAKVQVGVADTAKQVGNTADEYVHENPWQSVGISAAIGLLIGVMVGRR